jgi:acetyltransferase-like isoleucine patch superfamily enzyme
MHNKLAFSHSAPFNYLRNGILRLIGIKIMSQCDTSGFLYVLNGSNICLGNNVRIGCFARLYDFEDISIGDNALISHQVTIISGTHANNASRDYIPAPVEISSNVWIGINVTIVGPVKIGCNSVIGAGALVIRDVPDYAIVGGVPAKQLKERS